MTNENAAVVMATVLLLLASCSCSSSVVNEEEQKPPVNCTFDGTDYGYTMVIDCKDSRQSEAEQRGAIEAVLSKNTTAPFGGLTIKNSKITRIPELICELSELTELILDGNQLTELPINCFRRLPQLIKISANRNRIRHLQDGLFQGMEKLEHVSISENRLESIGLNLFSNASDLPMLKYIDLSSNNLTVLEPWPFVRGQVQSGTEVKLENNSISLFTNAIGWTFVCGMKPFALKLDLGRNNISRLSDFTEAYNLTKLVNLICLFGPKAHSPMDIEIYRNPIICDCQLLKFTSVVNSFQFTNFLNDVHCSKPIELANKKVIAVMSTPDKLVCDVRETCPANLLCTLTPSQLKLVVTTTSGPVDELPAELPPLKTDRFKYVLNLTQTAIRSVVSRAYLGNNQTSTIDLTKSSVDSITDDAWRDLTTVANIGLHSNHLKTLSPVIVDLDFAFKNLSLHGNPLSCDCENAWLKSWLRRHKERLVYPGGILCDTPSWLSGRVIFSVEDHEHCTDPDKVRVMAVGISTALGVLAVLVLLSFAVVRRLRVHLFAAFHLHPFDRDECDGEDMDYDVFLTCSHEDRSHAFKVLGVLEAHRYRVCYHEKDFLVGQTIADNICQAVFRSRRVVCLVSEGFLRSSYCVYEFETALSHSLKMKRKRVVVVLLEKVDVRDTGGSTELSHYLSSHTVVEYWTRDWTKNLLYALPTKPLSRPVDTPGQVSARDEVTCVERGSVVL